MISFKVIRSVSDPGSLQIHFRGTAEKMLAETRLIVVLLPFHIARARGVTTTICPRFWPGP